VGFAHKNTQVKAKKTQNKSNTTTTKNPPLILHVDPALKPA